MSRVAYSPQKPPFRPYFGAFYPHPANRSALRAEGGTTFWHNRTGPDLDERSLS